MVCAGPFPLRGTSLGLRRISLSASCLSGGMIPSLRKRNYSIYDISRALKDQGSPLSATAVREILAAEGFAPLPRRLDEERPAWIGPTPEAVADVRSFLLSPREFTTKVGGGSPNLPRPDRYASRRHYY
jgi:hypothetical protein